jgi:hypothetical protein
LGNNESGLSTVPVQTFGPQLTSEYLTERARRRGGPPSSYDLPTFCAVLRTGIDPAHVVIRRVMPRYDIASADCTAIWTYLTATRTQ